jgi:hypothetical protein
MQKVEGSNPFIRSMTPVYPGDVAEWLRHGSAKPATPVRLRSSPPQRRPASALFFRSIGSCEEQGVSLFGDHRSFGRLRIQSDRGLE